MWECILNVGEQLGAHDVGATPYGAHTGVCVFTLMLLFRQHAETSWNSGVRNDPQLHMHQLFVGGHMYTQPSQPSSDATSANPGHSPLCVAWWVGKDTKLSMRA